MSGVPGATLPCPRGTAGSGGERPAAGAMSGAGDGMADIIGQASARDVEGNYKKVGDRKEPFVCALRAAPCCQAPCAGHGAVGTGIGNGAWAQSCGHGVWEWGLGTGLGNGAWEWGLGTGLQAQGLGMGLGMGLWAWGLGMELWAWGLGMKLQAWGFNMELQAWGLGTGLLCTGLWDTGLQARSFMAQGAQSWAACDVLILCTH